MKKLIIGAAVLALIAGGAYASLNPGILGAAGPKGTSEVAPLPAQKAEGRIVSEARVVPLRSVALGLRGGNVAEVLVAEGDRVEAGQVLVRLDSAKQRVVVAQAEAGLSRAQARLQELKAGPRPEEIEGTQALLEAAQARLAELKAGPRVQEVEAAQAGKASAQAQLARLNQGARAEEISAAEAALAAAQAALEKVQQGPDEAQFIAARADLANAEAALTQAQAVYDKVVWHTDIGARPESVQLHQATNNHVAARARLENLLKQPDAAAIAAARAQVEQAQAKLDVLKAAARPADTAAAEADISRAEAQLQLARAGARPETIAAAQAEVRRARAQLQLLEAGTRPETIAAAEADVGAASATWEQARVALAETELRSPFAGTVASIDVKVGEQVAPGTPIARLADLSGWQIETTDLTELSIVRVTEGRTVTITFDAVPGLELSGKVTRIKAIGESKRGDVNYTVTITPDQPDARLRWNMTASVTIERQ